MNHTCDFFSFSSPAFMRNATILPSGDHFGSEISSSPRVYCRAVPGDPAVEASHNCVTYFQGLSFSLLSSDAKYATCDPSGEIRGDETRDSRNASIVPKSFFPSLLRGAGVSCFSLAS